jgi:phosphorylcholine metabolism protein LicD
VPKGPTLRDVCLELRRQARLVGRHVRHADARFTVSGRRAKQQALATLFDGVNTFLRSSGCEHWIVFGTLLGCRRENAILAHDKDVDFGAPVEAYPELLAAAASLPPGFELFDTSWKHGGPKLYVAHQGWEADIYFFKEEGGKLSTILSSSLPGDTAPFPREWFYPPSEVEFLGKSTWIPASPDLYLAHTYGYTGADAVLDRNTGYYRPRTPLDRKV